jgi:hypothetical protein
VGGVVLAHVEVDAAPLAVSIWAVMLVGGGVPPRRMTWVSRTALSTSCAKPLDDDGGNLVLGEIAGAVASPLDERPEFIA